MRRRGLTLGKFAPLHRGHQLLIDTALEEIDEVVVLIYDCPETISIPLPVRAEWIRSLCPGAQVVEAWDGPADVGDLPEIRQRHENYILHRLRLGEFTHFYSSEFYGRHMSRALGAVDRRVDSERRRVPISGSQIRKDPYACRDFIHPRVYRDLVANVVLLGAPGSGKTTLARRLAQAYDTVWMPEYGRGYWEQHQCDRRLTPDQLVELAEGHLAREEARIFEARRFLFTDTNALTTYVFSMDYHGRAPERLKDLVDRTVRRYDLVLLCDIDFACPDTWDRSGEAKRVVFHRRTLAELQARKIPYYLLRGSPKIRVEQVRRLLEGYEKFSNPAARWTRDALESRALIGP